jgi:glycosyltransferase involved in cell wall biosynthesis
MTVPRDIPQSTLAVVIPAYNAAATLPDCLTALVRSERRPDEIILFDDGSTDDTSRLARASGAKVIRGRKSKQGPAIGRNIGAAAATGSILVFVDADVVVHPDALGKLEAPLVAGEAVASFGSYDDRPTSRRVASLYANLRHHWIHQQGQSEAFTFWSGLGAIRSDTFHAHRGFDPAFTVPSIEDVELGCRIVESGGRIKLVKQALGTHRKDWSLAQLWTTDIFRRAVPWAQLIREGRGHAKDLNISVRERAAAILAHVVWLSAAATIWRPALWPAIPLALAAYAIPNARFYAFLVRAGGMRTRIAGMVLHWCYHLYASVTFALVALGGVLVRTRRRMMKPSAGRTHATRPW